MLKNPSRTALLILCFSACWLVEAEAQFRPPKQARELYIEVDDEGLEMLRRAERYVKISDWALAVQTYDKVLSDTRYTSMLYKDPKTKIITSLRARVREILLSLPPEGRHAYDRLRRVDAKLAWTKGVKGDLGELERVLSQYPATSFAGKAACRLAEISLETGEVDRARSYARLALSTFEKELGVEERVKAYRVWAYCDALGRRPAGIPKLVEKIDQIDAKAAETVTKISNKLFASLPERVLGKAPKLEKTLWAHSYPEYHSDRLAPQPMTIPHVHRNSVVFHNDSYAYSLSLQSGKLEWKTPIKDSAFEFIEPKKSCHLTLDGSRMFIAVDQSGLIALDAVNGEVKWSVNQEQLRKAAEVEFPLTVSEPFPAQSGRVYVPTITQGDNVEYRVTAFDSDTGQTLWTSLICSIRWGKAGPQFKVIVDGRSLYALTGDGVLTCLDSVDGSLVWLKEYAQGGNGQRQPIIGISGGRLLVAPPELNSVFAYDPLTGKELGRGPNKGGPRILGVYRNAFVRLYGNGDLRSGKGGQKLIAKLGKNLPLIATPRLIGKFAYFSLRPGLLIVDLTTGTKTFMKDWNGLKQPGHIIPTADRVIALTPRGAVAYGLASAVKKVSWEKDAKKEADAAFLVTCLGSENFAERERATDLLMKMGMKTKGVIAPLVKHGDLEVAMRAEDLLFEFGREGLKKKWQTVMRPEWIAEVPGLFDKLTHRNPKVRLDALDRVGAIDDPDILVLFKDLLSDKNPSIALKSAKILYRKGNRAGISVFETQLKTGTEKASVEILGELEKRKARSERMEDLPLARLAVASKHAKARVLGAGLLVDLGDRIVINDLKGLLKDKAPEVRVAAIKGLGDLALDRVAPILAPLVTDKARFVRFAAVKAISELETKVAADALCKACLDKDVPIARTAAEALLRFAEGENAGKISTAALSKALDVKDADVRRDVVSILMRGVNRPMKLLVRLAMDKSEAIHRKALDEIYNRAGPGDIQEVSKIAASPNVDVRFSAVQILGELGSPKAGPFLLKMLSDSDRQVREKAAEYLGSQANPWVVLDLIEKRQAAVANAKLITAENEKAKKALAAIGDKNKKDPKYLIALAATKKYAYRLKEVEAQRDVLVNLIENMEAETEAPGLILALKSKSLSVRQLAIEELEAIAGVTRNYKAEDPLEKRMKAFANWSRWYFMYKTDKDVEDTYKELDSKKPKERIEAAKALKYLWSKQSQQSIVNALKKEKLPWVAVEFHKVLENVFGKNRPLPKNPTKKDITEATVFWQKHLDSFEAKPKEKKAAPK